MAFHRRGPGSGSGPASSSSSGFHFLNSSFGDTTFTKVFVGGLAWETNNESLRHHFEQFGHILEAVVIADKSTGRSKGYGFVTFKEPESAQRACEDPTPVIDGRRANCNLASLRRLQPAISFVTLLTDQNMFIHRMYTTCIWDSCIIKFMGFQELLILLYSHPGNLVSLFQVLMVMWLFKATQPLVIIFFKLVGQLSME